MQITKIANMEKNVSPAKTLPVLFNFIIISLCSSFMEQLNVFLPLKWNTHV